VRRSRAASRQLSMFSPAAEACADAERRVRDATSFRYRQIDALRRQLRRFRRILIFIDNSFARCRDTPPIKYFH